MKDAQKDQRKELKDDQKDANKDRKDEQKDRKDEQKDGEEQAPLREHIEDGRVCVPMWRGCDPVSRLFPAEVRRRRQAHVLPVL